MIKVPTGIVAIVYYKLRTWNGDYWTECWRTANIFIALILVKRYTNRDAKLCLGSYKGGSHLMLQRSRLEHQELKLLGQELCIQGPSVSLTHINVPLAISIAANKMG
jgi:hypothetical protein